MYKKIYDFVIRNALILLILLVIATRIYPLVRGGITNLETLDTMLVIKQFAHGNTQIFFDESYIQVYLVTVPYSVLRGLLSIQQTMYVVKAALVLLSALIVYFFSKEIGGNRAGYLALLLFAVSPLAIYTQSLGVWTGDVISPIFLSGAILFMLYANKKFGSKSMYSYAAASIFFLVVAYASWNGGVYAVITYLFALFLIALRKLINSTAQVLLFGVVALSIAFLIYIPSPYNIGVFSGGNYVGGIFQTIIQFASNNNFSLYGTGDVRNPSDLGASQLYNLLLPIGFLTSTFLIAIAAYSFLRKNKAASEEYSFISAIVIYLIATVIALSDRRFDSLAILPIAMLSGVGLNLLIDNVKADTRRYQYTKFIFSILIILVLIGSIIQIIKAQYPTDLTYDYTSAMQWIRQSTPSNATFLTNIFDEAPIIYYGNRSSAIDGWNGGLWGRFPSNRIARFDNFLFAPQCNSTYLNSTGANYLVVDKFWLYYGFIQARNTNGTNMQQLIQNNNFHTTCGGLNLLLVYESGQNLTRIYSIQKHQVATNATDNNLALLQPIQASTLLGSNFTISTAPQLIHFSANPEGAVNAANETFISSDGASSLSVSYVLFENFSDAATVFLSNILALKNQSGITGGHVGMLFNTTYIYLNTTENKLLPGAINSSVAAAVYKNYLITIKSSGSKFTQYQAKQLIYNQIVNLNLTLNT